MLFRSIKVDELKQYIFPNNVGSTNNFYDSAYSLFPEALESDATVVFHGTNWSAFNKIKHQGFKPPCTGNIKSTSFSFRSPLALGYACSKRCRNNSGVVLVVQFEDDYGVSNEEKDVWYLYAHSENQPSIIGFCIIPDDYDHS